MPDLSTEHFRMLRLAIYRQLSCDQLSADVFRISSSREGHPPYDVDAVKRDCPCDSTVYCSHLALALDRWFEREADLQTRGEYFAARRMDFGGLPTRKDLPRDDKRFLAACVERARATYAPLLVNTEQPEGVTPLPF